MTVWTIGHSTRPIEEFVALLREAGVERVVDVRSVPRSRKNPQYNADILPVTLGALGLDAVHAPGLGGLRSRRNDLAASPNGLWRNASFRNYADYAMTPDFRAGLDELRRLGNERPSAIMCAEAVWWRCHRRIIADHLVASGEEVIHIMGPGKTE